MEKDPPLTGDSGNLRERAEQRLRALNRESKTAPLKTRASDDPRAQLHELQVYQIELELQNIELVEARDRLEVQVGKFTDLYDFAPVGYFSLDDYGVILEANLTGAILLGIERSRLLGRRFQDFVESPNGPVLENFLAHVFDRQEKQFCELPLRRFDGQTIWTDIQSSDTIFEGAQRSCRVAVSDLTALKRTEVLALANAELHREIDRRQAVEVSLRESEEKMNRLVIVAHHMEEQLRQLSHRLISAQEEERNRISRELHDDIAQLLVGIHVHLQSLTVEGPAIPPELKKRIVRTQQLVTDSVDRVKQFARDLRPAMLDDLGLVPALNDHCKVFTKESHIPVRFEHPGDWEKLGKVERTVLFRVAQSALANVVRHAEASEVTVRLRATKKYARLEIRDNGAGFDVDRTVYPDGRKRLGLVGMRERLNMIGGSLVITSQPGKGTSIQAQLPLA